MIQMLMICVTKKVPQQKLKKVQTAERRKSKNKLRLIRSSLALEMCESYKQKMES